MYGCYVQIKVYLNCHILNCKETLKSKLRNDHSSVIFCRICLRLVITLAFCTLVVIGIDPDFSGLLVVTKSDAVNWL